MSASPVIGLGSLKLGEFTFVTHYTGYVDRQTKLNRRVVDTPGAKRNRGDNDLDQHDVQNVIPG